MLPSSRRLRAEEVREVIARGRSARARFLSMKYQKTDEPLRLAAVVSKKVAKTAVGRNRLRRALYRALAVSGSVRGRAAFFINAIPAGPLSPAFAQDAEALLKM